MYGILLLYFACLFVRIESQEYEVPDATLMAYSPKGLHVSIPHEEGIEIFAFHGNVNSEMKYPSAGEMSVDILAPKNGRWIYENPRIKLKPGDVINYWLYVQKRGKGYPKEDLTWKVDGLVNKNTGTLPPVTPPTNRPCQPTITSVNGLPSCQGKLIFEDTFDKLQLSKWQHVIQFGGDPGYPFVLYTHNEANCFADNGNLHIKPLLQPEDIVTSGQISLKGCTGSPTKQECQKQAFGANYIPPVLTAQLRTKQSFSFRYGRVEVRAKLPLGDWLYSEILLKPTHNIYGSEPKLASGQMNLALMRGNRECSSGGSQIGAKVLEGNCEMSFNGIRHRERFNRTSSAPWGDNFHIYGLVWTPDSIVFSVDGNEVGRVVPSTGGFKSMSPYSQYPNVPWSRGSKIAPFDQEFYLSLGVEAGGFYEFPDGAVSRDNKVKPWRNGESKAIFKFWMDKNNWFPTWNADNSVLQVDYIRVWAL